MEDEKGVFCMRMDEILIENERRRKEDRKKKECEPYEEIIRRLGKRDKEKAALKQSPTDRRS
jgi:hypothetical protein